MSAPPPASGSAGPPAAARVLRWVTEPLDRLFDRIYGARWNPLYQSGNLAVLCFLVCLATGVYLFLFYKIADPHGSVVRIDERIFLGSWMRSLHRYSADLAMVALTVHLLRKLVQGQTWGPRALAWLSGVALLGIVLFCGWTGLVMVWDVQGQLVASRGARLVDLLPVLSEPLSRSFNGEATPPSSFFFMNLFLHVALPLGITALLWLHVSRLSRPAWLPPRELRWFTLALLAVLAAVAPVALPPAADLLALPGVVPTDLFYAFWLPLADRLAPASQLALWAGAFALLASLPWWWRPRRAIATSTVDESHCSGCTNCYQDCPYESIAMVARTDFAHQRSELVARVDPARCVGCGICAASCAPMGVGPFERTGRDQLTAARAFLDRRAPQGDEVVVLGCRNGLAALPEALALPGIVAYPTGCSGSVHTSVVELLLRRGVGGVFLLSCPPRNCHFREGPKWAAARLFRGREAELKPRVDRRRVGFASYSPAEAAAARRRLQEFQAGIAALAVVPEPLAELDLLCAAAAAELTEVTDG